MSTYINLKCTDQVVRHKLQKSKGDLTFKSIILPIKKLLVEFGE